MPNSFGQVVRRIDSEYDPPQEVYKVKLFCGCMHDPEFGTETPEEKDWHIDELIVLNTEELENRIINHKECNYGKRTSNL